MWSFYGIREWRADTKVSTATDSEEDATLFTVRPQLVEGQFLLLASVVIVAQSFLISASFFARLQPLIRLSASSASSRDGNSRSEEHTSELQSLMRRSYAVFCLKTKTTPTDIRRTPQSKKPQPPHTPQREFQNSKTTTT